MRIFFSQQLRISRNILDSAMKMLFIRNLTYLKRLISTGVKRMKSIISTWVIAAGVAGAAISVGHPAKAADIYGPFPVTYKDWVGPEKNSVAYTGQMARHVLHDSLKALAGKGNGKPNPELKKKMLSYYAEKDAGRKILAPKSNKGFKIKQTGVDQISKKKNLAGKTYKGLVPGWPGNKTGKEVVLHMIDKASSAKKGFDPSTGYDYKQLISKFIMGAVSYNQAVDNYLDEKLGPNKKPNDKQYKKGKPYTGKEHSWDEAFGYWGAAAHGLTLTAKQNYEIAKRGKKSKSPEAALKYADYNGDGVVDLYREFNFGHAYYAAAYDKKGRTSYYNNITRGFIYGRTVIAKAKGKKLTDVERGKLRSIARSIEANWEKVIAESIFKYAGSVYKDLDKMNTIIEAKGNTDKVFRKYAKHWGELKGFSMALQMGRKNQGEIAVKLNRMIGFGPVLPNGSQVVDVERNGDFVKDQGQSMGEYMLHMLKIQRLMVKEFDVKARVNDKLASLEGLIKKVGKGDSAEND